MSMRIATSLLLTTLLWLPGATTARAAPINKRLARHHFTEGKRHFLTGNYARAVRAFQEAYRHRPHRVILFNIALTQARLGRLRAAAANLRRYLANAKPTDPPLPPELRSLGRRLVRPDASARGQGAAPDATTLPSQPQRGWRRFQRLHWAYFAAGLGTTVALLASAVATSVRTRVIDDDYAQDPSDTVLRAEGLRMQRATNVLWGVTAVSAAATVAVALFTRWKPTERARRLVLQPALGPRQAGFSLHWKY